MGKSRQSGKREKRPPRLKASLASDLKNLLIEAELTIFLAPSRLFGADFHFIVSAGKRQFSILLDTSSVGDPNRALATVGKAHLKRRSPENTLWVFGAPYISERTADICQEGGIGFIDLEGNHDIRYGAVRLSRRTVTERSGPTKVQRSLFSPKASRVSLALLLHPEEDWTQRSLASEVGISPGLVSRTIRQLAVERYVERIGQKWRLSNFNRLLEAWASEYLKKPPKQNGFFSRLQPNDILARLCLSAAESKFRFALTGESAAGYRAPWGSSSRLVLYAEESPARFAKTLGLKPVDRGANVVVLEPPDQAVFRYMRRIGDPDDASQVTPPLWLTNDIYIYLDLWASPGRGKDQAEHLLEVIHKELPRRPLSTEELARKHRFLKMQQEAQIEYGREHWESALRLYDKAMKVVSGIGDDSTAELRMSAQFATWRCVMELIIQNWKEGERPGALIRRMLKEVPDEDKIISSFPQVRMVHGVMRYLLGLRRSIMAADSSAVNVRRNHLRSAADHFEIATSQYTEGSERVSPWADSVRQWIKRQTGEELRF